MGSGNENGGNRGITEGGYCLRWNNHKSNLVEILESLIKMECYVDCTIYVDNHVQFKAHRVVLAACSPYFQLILQDAPQDHCSIIFPGVQEFEMRTLLEYIYAGEVNIAESQIPRIMKIAKMLEVKGLLDMVDLTSNISQQSTSVDERERREPVYNPTSHSSPIITTSTKISSAQSSSSPPYSKAQFISSLYQNSNSNRDLIPHAGRHENLEESNRNQWNALPLPLSRNAQSMLSSVYESGSDMNPLKRKKLSSISSMLMTRDTPILRNVLAQSNVADSSQGVSPNAIAVPIRGGNGESGSSNDNIENNDTNNNENNNGSNAGNTSGGNNNGSVYVGYARKSSDRSYHSSNGSDHSEKKFKDEEPSSPLTDRSFDDEPMHGERRTSPPEFLSDMRIPAYLQQHPSLQQAQFHQQLHGSQSGSSQKPEWKRYKQYTRNDIMSAIECVRNGMSALQASRKFGVPSRTLYDKVKKLGITTGTPRNRSSGKREGRDPGPSSSIAAFPYGSLSGPSGAFNVYPNQDSQLSQSQDFDEDELKHHQRTHPASLLDQVLLQKALEARSEELRGDALQAMALAAAAHAQFNGLGGHTSSHESSPSMLAKYMNRSFENELLRERERGERERSSSNGGAERSIKTEPIAAESEDEMMEPSEKAENLSMSKIEKSPSITPPIFNEPPRGVIVPPMKYSSPRSEPTSTTPPSNEQPLALDSSTNKQVSESTLIPTTMANYDD